MADGSIRIETKLDTQGVENGFDDIEKMGEDAKRNLEEIGKTLNLEARVSIDDSQLKKVGDSTQAELEKIAEALDFKVKPVSITNESGLNKAQKKLADIQAEIEKIQAETDKILEKTATDDQAAKVLEVEAEETKKLIAEQKELNRAIEEYKQKKAAAAEIKQAKTAEKQYKSDVKSVNTDVGTALVGDDFLSKINTAEEYEAALVRIRSRMAQIEAETNKLAAAKGIDPEDALRTNKEYQKLKSQLDALTNTTKKFRSATKGSFEEARKGADRMGDSIKKALKTMTKYSLAVFGARSAFYAIKGAIGEAVSENEKLSNTVNGMKGAFAYALTPVIEKVVYYIQYGLAYLNLFIKTLTGVDIVAKYNANALEKQAEATKKTAKATKEANNQLAGFDEKNMLTSNSASNADTSAIENAAATLELPDVSGGKFEQICETIKKNLGDILAFAGGALIAIGLILLVCGQIPMGIAALIAGVALTAAAIQNSSAMTDQVGTMINTIMLIAGGALLALGIMLVTFGLIPLGAALIAGGAALLVSALAVKVNAMPDEAQAMITKIMAIAGAALLVLGIILTFCPVSIPLAIACIALGAALLVTAAVLAINKLPDDVKGWIMAITAIVSVALLVLGIILCATGVNIALGVALIAAGAAGLVTVLALNKDAIKNWVSDAWASVTNFWNSKIKPVFTVEWWRQKFDSIPGAIKAAFNSAISLVEKGINWIVGKVNTLSFTVPSWVPSIGGSRFGFNLSYVTIPRLAKGGIVNNPGRGQHIIAGEAGAEAVLPLETNTEWMNILAEKIAEKISVPFVNKFYVDGKEVHTSYNKNQERFNFATNGGVL